MIRRPPRSTLFPYNDALPICTRSRMTTANPREMLAEALGALGATLRHHRDLGFTGLPLTGDYLLSPAEGLRAQERALAGCRRCKLCAGRTTIVFGAGNPRADLVCIGEG